MEATLSELTQRRGGVFVAQQRLGREDDERLAQIANHLTAQHMEDLAGCGGLHNLHIGVCCQLHKALNTR